MKKMLLIAVLTLMSTVMFSQNTLKINVDGLSNNKGQLVVSLFKKGQAFGVHKMPFRKIIADEIINGKCSIIINDVEKGEYAFTVFHDEDKNGELKTNWFRMPKEGIGKSGNQKARPSFENSKFTFSGGSKTFNVKLKYL